MLFQLTVDAICKIHNIGLSSCPRKMRSLAGRDQIKFNRYDRWTQLLSRYAYV